MELRNPFGLRNGELVVISDLFPDEKGAKCNCICPSCEAPFLARMGDVRQHHFAHSGEGCDAVNAYLAGLYLLLQEYLASSNALQLPPIVAEFELTVYKPITENNVRERVKLSSEFHNSNDEIQISKSRSFQFAETEIIKSSSGRSKAIIATTSSNHKLAIVIQPPSTVCTDYIVKPFQDYSTILIDLSKAADMMQTKAKSEIFDWLAKNTTKIMEWVYNRNIEKAYPLVLERSKRLIIKYNEKKRREREEREKALKELQAKIQREAEERRKDELAWASRKGKEFTEFTIENVKIAVGDKVIHTGRGAGIVKRIYYNDSGSCLMVGVEHDISPNIVNSYDLKTCIQRNILTVIK